MGKSAPSTQTALPEGPAEDEQDIVLLDDEVTAVDPMGETAANRPEGPAEDFEAPAARTSEPATRLNLRPVTVALRPATTMLRRETPAPAGPKALRHRAPPSAPDCVIPGGQQIVVNQHSPWDVEEALRYLEQGKSKHEESLRGASIITLGKRNGFWLWVLLGEVVLFVGLTAVLCWTVLSKPAFGKPSTAAVAFYHRSDVNPTLISNFATMMASWMNTWNYRTAPVGARRILPYLDPRKRGEFEADWDVATRDSKQFKEHSICEVLGVRYKGLQKDTIHVVEVFVQVYRGRGQATSDSKWDSISRQYILMSVGESDVSAENPLGLYVYRTVSFTERNYMEYIAKGGPNPWDEALGIKPVKAKGKPKPKIKAGES